MISVRIHMSLLLLWFEFLIYFIWSIWYTALIYFRPCLQVLYYFDLRFDFFIFLANLFIKLVPFVPLYFNYFFVLSFLSMEVMLTSSPYLNFLVQYLMSIFTTMISMILTRLECFQAQGHFHFLFLGKRQKYFRVNFWKTLHLDAYTKYKR